MENKKIILSIDDNVVQLKLYQEMLSHRFDFRAVKSASEALNFLNAIKVDLILLDIEMPNITGFEFLKDIRKIPSYMDVPVIIISGKTGADFIKEARNSSAADVLSKPVNPDDLLSSIERAFTAAT